MGASSNFGNMFSVLGASYLFPFLPMLPIQILANNLLYDFSQTGIPSDNVDKELITKPLKWDISNIKRFMIFVGPISSIFDFATFALMWFFFGCSLFLNPAVYGGQKTFYERLFQTGWFVESLLTQTLIVHIIRTKRIPFIKSRASISMTLTTLAIMMICVWLPYSPFAPSLSLVPLPAIYWLWIAGFLLCYSIITHLVKTWFFKKYEGD
jgi:Mg2+-importing ATPase